jgi:polyisoprenyl-phosphate glycosyltransferase
MTPLRDNESQTDTVSVVIPVYQGEETLAGVVREILALAARPITPSGYSFDVHEIILVDDNGKDASDQVIRELAAMHGVVRPVWLSRNFGQHAATLAGISASSGDWIVTIDEDGQHDPADIGLLLDAAIEHRAQVAYGAPINEAPHGALRNAASKGAKRIANRMLGTVNSAQYNSFRLVEGTIAREVATRSGAGVYLDVALAWVAGTFTTAPITLRNETRSSGYNFRRLLGHFWRLVITSGTRGLRVVSIAGAIFALVGVLIALWVVFVKLVFGTDTDGWASTIVVLLLTSGATLFSLGVIAEYIGVSVNMALGKPQYLVITDPADGPLRTSRVKRVD